MSEICERSEAPTKGEQEGKAPAESGGRGRYSPPATPERVTSKSYGAKGQQCPGRKSLFLYIINMLQGYPP